MDTTVEKQYSASPGEDEEREREVVSSIGGSCTAKKEMGSLLLYLALWDCLHCH